MLITEWYIKSKLKSSNMSDRGAVQAVSKLLKLSIAHPQK